MSCTQQQQLVSFPKVRIQKEWFRYFIDHKAFKNEGNLHLFSLISLYSYANFRSNTRKICNIEYHEAPGEWTCKLSSLPRILRVSNESDALNVLNYFSQNGLISFEHIDPEIIRYHICDWERHCVHLDYPLPLGRYFVQEVNAPGYYQKNKEKLEAEIEFPGQIVKLSQYDKSAILGVTIKKTGNREVQPGQTMRYDFTGISNTSNVSLNNFFWHDRVPTDATRAMTLTTGTYNTRLYYRVTYKTNYSDYRVAASNLLSTNNYSIHLSAAALGLSSGEYVTDVRLEFGTVPSGFTSKAKPTLTVQTLGTVSNGYQIINRADVGGKYLNEWQTAKTSWITKVYRFHINATLPKTGF